MRWGGACAGVLGVLLPNPALANDTCNGFINIDYVGAPPVTPIGDTVDMEIRLGTGSIQGGTKLTLKSLELNLDCNANFPLVPPVHGRGPHRAVRGGHRRSRPTVPTTWTTAHGVGPNPNEVFFIARIRRSASRQSADAAGLLLDAASGCACWARASTAPARSSSSSATASARATTACCSSGGFQTSSIVTPPPLHFELLRDRERRHPAGGVTLQDRFGTTTASVVEAKRLCAPTNKNNEDPSASAAPDHLVAYRMTATGGSFLKPKDLKVSNQFGPLSVDIVSPALLMTPTAKSLTPPPPPPLAAASLSHFQCYKIDNVKNASATGDAGRSVRSAPPSLDKRGPFHLCVPVNKNGEDPDGAGQPQRARVPDDAQRSPAVPDKTVFLTNQFGPLVAKFTQYDELCVPSVILP